MLTPLFVLGILAGCASSQQLTYARSFTGWDCCKPVCSNGARNDSLLTSRGMVQVCDRNNRPMSLEDGMSATTACSNGNAYLCDSFQPVPVSNNLSYGFVILVGGPTAGDNPNCCKCFELQWLSGLASGKKMIVQAVTPGGALGDVKNGDMIILTPGGGLGPLTSGCRAQYGGSYSWDTNNDGRFGRTSCENMPDNLKAGCYWRYNWAGSNFQGWNIAYKQVACPSRLTQISGCENNM